MRACELNNFHFCYFSDTGDDDLIAAFFDERNGEQNDIERGILGPEFWTQTVHKSNARINKFPFVQQQQSEGSFCCK